MADRMKDILLTEVDGNKCDHKLPHWLKILIYSVVIQLALV